MTKYEPLTKKLQSIPYREWPTSFAEIERTLGFRLPKSAREHRAWWSNNPSNSVMTKAWLAAGWRTERVDMESGKLLFRKVSGPTTRGSAPLFGALAGSVRILTGDITQPTGEAWNAEQN
ncbi:MAG TPA: hypothetical protein VHD34_02540 [Xanthobacteraceae bacterium]|nr:hypothetical protein [Xanthobacteraceae bacterium]